MPTRDEYGSPPIVEQGIRLAAPDCFVACHRLAPPPGLRRSRPRAQSTVASTFDGRAALTRWPTPCLDSRLRCLQQNPMASRPMVRRAAVCSRWVVEASRASRWPQVRSHAQFVTGPLRRSGTYSAAAGRCGGLTMDARRSMPSVRAFVSRSSWARICSSEHCRRA